MTTNAAQFSPPPASQCSQIEARLSQKHVCADYNETRLKMQAMLKINAFVWIEAVEMPQGAAVWRARSDSIAYAIHTSSKEADVPPFAIEVYERGSLSRYETERSRIHELSMMPETDRRSVIQAQKDQSGVPEARPALSHGRAMSTAQG